ncbi:MAG: VCBS repeat-containing protein [Verrucomicrobiota bacterium]|nr:VCBS repeat-containing protein [Verrucomicrobiota bacterium]
MEFNGDGKPDILSGCYSEHDPMAGLFWLLTGTGDGGVAKAVAVNGSDGKPLIIPASEKEIVKSICTHPAAHDWDGDGDLDILTGNFEGTYFLFRNQGSKQKASFHPKPQQIMAGDQPLRLEGAHSGVCPVDWDGDGDMDLVTGSARGGAFLAENQTRGKGVPQFTPFRQLLPPAPAANRAGEVPPAEAALPTAPGDNTRVWAADVNGDGKLDLLVGDCARLVARAEGLSEEAFKTKQAAWQKEMDEAQEQSRKGRSSSTSADASKKLSALYEKRRQFIEEERTGFVWLVLRK